MSPDLDGRALNGSKVAILVAEGVEDLEYYVPVVRLLEEGAEVLAAALELKALRGKNGLTIIPDALINSLRADDLLGLVTPGGWAPGKLRRYAVLTDSI
jgi:protease I